MKVFMSSCRTLYDDAMHSLISAQGVYNKNMLNVTKMTKGPMKGTLH